VQPLVLNDCDGVSCGLLAYVHNINFFTSAVRLLTMYNNISNKGIVQAHGHIISIVIGI